MSEPRKPPLQAALYRLPSNRTLVASASRRLFQVDMSPDSLIERLTAATTPGGPEKSFDSEQEHIVATLRRDGCLGADPSTADWLRFGPHVGNTTELQRIPIVLIGRGRLVTLLLEHNLFGRFHSVLRAEVASVEDVIKSVSNAPPIIVGLSDSFDFDTLTAIDDLSSKTRLRYISLHVDGGKGWLGPAVVPGETPNYRDLVSRRFCAARSVAQFHALTNGPIYGQPHVPPDPELLWMLAILVAEVERWAAGSFATALWTEIELDPVTFKVAQHPLLPLPDREQLRAPRGFNLDVFVDERTGIVNRVDRIQTHPSVPRALRIVQSVACDVRRISYCANGRLNHGSSFEAEHAARAAAIGESIERYCGNWFLGRSLVEASYDELAAAEDHAVDPEQLVLHSPSQYAAPGFPFVPFTRNLRVKWVLGHCLTCDVPAWVPASLAYVNWYLGPHYADPPTNYAPFSGIAAGPSWDTAVAAGLEELIERDAKMIWWLNGHPLPGVQLTDELRALWAGPPTALGQRARLVYVENEFDVPVMAGIVENVDDGLLTIGFAARPDPADAALKAWAEALALQETARLLKDASSSFWTITAKLLGDEGLKRPHASHRYLDMYRDDFHDVNTLLCQLQVNLDPRARDAVRRWIEVAPIRSLTDVPRLRERTAAVYRERLEKRGFEIFAVDMTTPDVAVANVKVARVVVPGLVPNYPAAFLPLGRRRVQDAGVTLGWRNESLDESKVNTFPMPHA